MSQSFSSRSNLSLCDRQSTALPSISFTALDLDYISKRLYAISISIGNRQLLELDLQFNILRIIAKSSSQMSSVKVVSASQTIYILEGHTIYSVKPPLYVPYLIFHI